MIKKELYALPVLPPPQLEVPECIERQTPWGNTYKEYGRIYAARIIKGVLEITGYTADGIPLWRTWQDKEQVIGQTMGENPKPSKSTIDSRMKERWSTFWSGPPEADETIRQWVEKNHWDVPKNMTGMELAAWSQTKTRHKKRDERWDRIRREIDNEMLEIRELPKNFERWVLREVFQDHHYLVYDYRKGAEKQTAICTVGVQ